MPEFLELLPPDLAREKWFAYLGRLRESERIETAQAAGRVSSQVVNATISLPSFDRSTVDGFAVKARDTFGASDSLPAYLHLVGEVPMGSETSIRLGEGECALIHTGGMIPQGATAVVMVEHTQRVRQNEIEVLKPAADGENVLKMGEDVSLGEEVIPSGTLLQPAEIGGLMALGITQVDVVRKPRVGVISTGDEVIQPELEPGPGQVRDINAYTLSALIQSAGGLAVRYGIVPDNENKLFETAAQAKDECDFVVITAGSSASTRDLTSRVVDKLGAPGVLVHGVNVRPGKPTILGVCDSKGIVGLPGNPVSALVIASLFVVPAIKNALGIRESAPEAGIRAELSINLSSQSGREDWVPVRVVSEDRKILAEPVFGKSNLIFTLVRANGLVCIPEESNGLSAGEIVMVYPLHQGCNILS